MTGMSGLTEDELALVAQLTDELEIEPMELQDALACLSTSEAQPASASEPAS